MHVCIYIYVQIHICTNTFMYKYFFIYISIDTKMCIWRQKCWPRKHSSQIHKNKCTKHTHITLKGVHISYAFTHTCVCLRMCVYVLVCASVPTTLTLNCAVGAKHARRTYTQPCAVVAFAYRKIARGKGRCSCVTVFFLGSIFLTCDMLLQLFRSNFPTYDNCSQTFGGHL